MTVGTWRPEAKQRVTIGPVSLRAAAVCVVVSIAIGALAYVVGTLLPSTYQSNGLIRVAVPSQQGISDPVVTAANDTASQYAVLASSAPVQAAAASKLGVPASTLDGAISGSTVSAQNIVQVTATGHSAAVAQARAAAASAALANYVTGLNSAAGNRYVSQAEDGLGRLNQTLQAITGRLGSDRPARRAADMLMIETLTSERDQLLGQISRDAASNQPTLQVVAYSSSPTLSSPKPKLYAVVAFVVALIVAGRIAFVLARRRAG